MKYKTLDNFNFKGKRVLLRSDLNSEISNGKVSLSDRIIESAKTINELKRKGAKVVVLAHQSRPGEKDFTSLSQHSRLLNKYTKIKFVNDIIGKKALKEIDKLKDSEALLLENIRFLKEEFKPSPKNKIVKILKGKFDIFINDAFSVCHRKQTSVVSFAQILDSGIGRLVEKELESLEKIRKDCLYILGGAKLEENMLLLGKKKVLTGGLFAHYCLEARGVRFGIKDKIIKSIKKKLHNGVKTPSDLAIEVSGKRKELDISAFPSKYNVYDVGSKTIEDYIREIKKSRAIFMKGPLGRCEDKKFCKGTEKILKAIASNKGYSILSGGHTATAVKKLKINKNRFSYVSLSGGATVKYILGDELPGLKVLRRRF